MRLALISDIHGNFVTLQTVLADIEKQHVDQLVCLGDVACNGPCPRQVIHRLNEMGCKIVMGNTDEMFLSAQSFEPKNERERQVLENIRWSLEQPSAEEIKIIQSFKPLIDIPLEHDHACSVFTVRRCRTRKSFLRRRLMMSYHNDSAITAQRLWQAGIRINKCSDDSKT
jgi:hypothetical protein